jgi:hypothetical protein
MRHLHPTEYGFFLKRTVLILSGFFISLASCPAQSPVDEGLTGLFERQDTTVRDYAAPLREAQNDISVIASTGFLLYKTFISSQDNPSCVFTPSFSEYAVEAIQEHGLIVGWLMAFDRLSRCHGLVNPDHYPFDMEKQRFYDPVR